MKTPKVIQVKIDGIIYSSTIAPETFDVMDGTCPACGAAEYHEIMTLIQHGFTIDVYITLMTCRKCFESFHYVYEFQSPIIPF